MTITDTASNALTWINSALKFSGAAGRLWSDDLHQRVRPDGLPKSAWPRVRLARRAVLVNQHRTGSPLTPHVTLGNTHSRNWYFVGVPLLC